MVKGLSKHPRVLLSTAGGKGHLHSAQKSCSWHRPVMESMKCLLDYYAACFKHPYDGEQYKVGRGHRKFWQTNDSTCTESMKLLSSCHRRCYLSTSMTFF